MRTDSILASTPPPVSPDTGQSRATDNARQDQQRVADLGASGATDADRRGEGVDTFVRSVESNEETPRPRDEPVESGTDPRTERALQAYREAERTQS